MGKVDQALQNDADIVRLACQGDEIAWEALVRAYPMPVFRLAYLLLGSADEAEDVAQETFIRAYRSLERFDTTRHLRPWLFKIATNLAHNQRRSMGRYLAALGRLFQFERGSIGVPTGGAPAEVQGDQHQEAEELWRAVRALGMADQQIIYFRYFLGLSVDETAESMGLAQGTVKSRLHRALERLRKVIEQDFPVWTLPEQPDAARLSLHAIEPGSWTVEKVKPLFIQETTVNGQPAVWAAGPYIVRLLNGDLHIRRIIVGNVLIWTEDGITYRLETDLPIEEAVRIAESLK